MQKTEFEKILDQIAHASQTSPGEIREKMQQAMEAALKDPSPSVQAMWSAVPKQGSTPTLDEFMAYLIDKKLLLP